MRARIARGRLALILAAAALASSCSKTAKPGASETHGYSQSEIRTRDAYARLDRGETAAAIAILEEELAANPKNSEARILLASAFMGQAGIDLYSVHDHFGDLLFDKPLSESLWKSPTAQGPSARPVEGEPAPAPVKLLIDQLDHVLEKLRLALSFLNRFPFVEERNWPLIEQALNLLEIPDAPNDLRLYRVFARVVYVRAYLSVRIVDNPKFASREWSCNLSLIEFETDLQWFSKQLLAAIHDFQVVFPTKAFSLDGLQIEAYELLIGLEKWQLNALPGARSGLYYLNQQIKTKLSCPGSQPEDATPSGFSISGVTP